MSMTKGQVLQDVEKTSIQLMLKEPFYGHFFSNLIREAVEDEHAVNTAAICLSKNNTLSLLVNRKFWDEELKGADINEGKQLKYGIVKHEILHILFKHIFNYNKFTNKTIANIAVDIVVNQCIKPEQLPMKDKIAIIENFPEFFPDRAAGGKDAHQTSEYYYKRLIEEAKKVRDTLQEGKCDQSGEQGESQQGQGGQGGSGGDQDQNDNQDQEGNGDNGENGEQDSDEQQGKGGRPEDNPNWDKLNESQKHLAKFLQSQQQTHGTWEQLSKMGKGKKEFVESWVDNAVQETVKKCDRSSQKDKWRGTMPGELLDYIDELLESLKPSVNWKKLLRQFAANGEQTYLQPTLKRRSKRYGTFPGLKIVKECKIMVAIDTSGSVDNASLAEFFSEIHHIHKAGAEIHIVEADWVIGNKWDYRGKPPGEITGRGGTSFDEPIMYANDEYKPDALIYFTDGYASPPPKCNCPLMWILCKNGSCEPEDMISQNFQGMVVKMDF